MDKVIMAGKVGQDVGGSGCQETDHRQSHHGREGWAGCGREVLPGRGTARAKAWPWVQLCCVGVQVSERLGCRECVDRRAGGGWELGEDRDHHGELLSS